MTFAVVGSITESGCYMYYIYNTIQLIFDIALLTESLEMHLQVSSVQML